LNSKSSESRCSNNIKSIVRNYVPQGNLFVNNTAKNPFSFLCFLTCLSGVSMCVCTNNDVFISAARCKRDYSFSFCQANLCYVISFTADNSARRTLFFVCAQVTAQFSIFLAFSQRAA
jgi:hypothetical protein